MNSISEGERYVTVVTSTVLDNLERGPELNMLNCAVAVLLIIVPAGVAAKLVNGSSKKIAMRLNIFLNPQPLTGDMN